MPFDVGKITDLSLTSQIREGVSLIRELIFELREHRRVMEEWIRSKSF